MKKKPKRRKRPTVAMYGDMAEIPCAGCEEPLLLEPGETCTVVVNMDGEAQPICQRCAKDTAIVDRLMQ